MVFEIIPFKAGSRPIRVGRLPAFWGAVQLGLPNRCRQTLALSPSFSWAADPPQGRALPS